MSDKILVIDNHQDTINLVTMILKTAGYRLSTANTGREGIEAAKKVDPDLILLDVMMPDMDGLAVCRELRSIPRFGHVPIIMFTAKSMPDEKWEGFESGATDYLVKPTTSEELTKRVKMILSRSQPQKTSSIPQAPSTPVGYKGDGNGPRGQTIAFIGARGGSGTTTAAINTAMVLAARYPVLLVDLDMVQGHVGQYLKRNDSGGLNRLIEGGVVTMKAQINNEAVMINDLLQVLLAHPNITDQNTVAEPQHTPHLVEAVGLTGKQVIFDGGRGITPLNRPVIERADQIVVCTRPERLGLEATKVLLEQLDDIILPTTLVHTMMMNFDGTHVAAESIEKYINHKLIGAVQVTPQQMAKAVNRGLALVQAYGDTPLPRAFAEVAKTILAAA